MGSTTDCADYTDLEGEGSRHVADASPRVTLRDPKPGTSSLNLRNLYYYRLKYCFFALILMQQVL